MALYQFNGKTASFLFLDGRVIQNFIPLKMSYTIKDPKELHEFDSNFKYQIEVFEDNENYRVNIYSENDFEWFKCNINTLTVDYLKLTNKVTDMSYMFSNCSLLSSLDLTNCDTSNVTNMSHIFENCTSLTSLDLTSFDTSNVTNMSYFFSGCSVSTNRNFNISKVEDMSYMYYNFGGKSTSGWHIDWSNSDTSSLTNTSHMFYGCKNVTKLNLSGWDTSNLSNYENMFYDLPSSVNWCYDGSNYSKWTLTEADTGFSGTFAWNIEYTVTVKYLDTNGYAVTAAYKTKVKNKKSYDVSNKVKISIDGCTYKEAQGNIKGTITSNVTIKSIYENSNYIEYTVDNSSEYFTITHTYVNDEGTSYYYYLPRKEDCSHGWKYFILLLKDGTTTENQLTKIKNVSKIRVYYSNLTSFFKFNLHMKLTGITYMNTSKFTDMSYMFYNCKKLTSLDLSNFNTSKVTNMSYMFSHCESLTSLDLTSFDTSKVTNMSDMFSYCKKLTSLDLSSFNTSKVTNMSDMFYNCKSLTSLDLSNFDTRLIGDDFTKKGGMFSRVPTTINWHYNGNNYTNWTITEIYTGYDGTFPWNK